MDCILFLAKECKEINVIGCLPTTMTCESKYHSICSISPKECNESKYKLIGIVNTQQHCEIGCNLFLPQKCNETMKHGVSPQYLYDKIIVLSTSLLEYNESKCRLVFT